MSNESRARAERIAAARALIEASTSQLETALGNVSSTGITNPVLEELREAIVSGRKMAARTQEILKRIPKDPK